MKFKPGVKAPKTGTYKMVDKNGKTVNTVYVNKNDTLPPCFNSSCHYEN